MRLRKLVVLSLGIIVTGVLAVNAVEINQKQKVNDKLSVPVEVKATFVELGSVNCIPCKMMQPVMKDIEKEYGAQVKVIFYDVWAKEGKQYAEQYSVQAIPTQVFLDKNGKEFFRHIGFFPKEEIVKVLEKQGIKQVVSEIKLITK